MNAEPFIIGSMIWACVFVSIALSVLAAHKAGKAAYAWATKPRPKAKPVPAQAVVEWPELPECLKR